MSAKQSIDLDDGQRAAVDAPVADATNVIAGAGTGKTSVLVERYVNLVGDGVPIERLLALTFTLKAAGEMRERVRRTVAERHPALVRRMSGAWIMNFHQFGYRFIKENAPALGIDPGVDVVSIAEFERIQRVLRARFESGRVAGVPSDFGGAPPPPTKLGSLFDTLMKVVLHCRGIMLEPPALRAMVTASDHPAYIARVDTVVALAREYEEELARRGLLDFSDMITIPARALHESPALGRAYGSAFDHILVDEFQDTSAAQNELLRALSGGNFSRVTVVGDKKQSIYRWRDARVENISEFPDPDPRELTMNYRSRQEILDLAHALVMGEAELRDAAVKLTAHRGAGEASVLLFHPPEGQERDDDEAEALGAWVDHLLGRVPAPSHWELEPMATRLAPHDIAVLMRRFASSKLMPAIERVFQRRGIPFAVVGGANRVEARALESWHAWLSLLLPGDRTVDLVAVLEASPYVVTEASLAELFAAPTNGLGVAEKLDEERIANVQNERDAAAMRDVRASVEQAAEAWRARDFREFLVWGIESSPLRTRLLRDGAQPAAVDELLRELLDLADGLARRRGLNLATFLDHLRASLDERKFHEEGDAVLPRDRVAVMTVHQAKGLEFPAAAVVGVVDTTSRAESFHVSRASGLYFGEKTGKPWHREKERAENHAREEHMEDVEERCVLYVALTRARDHLWVSAPSVEGRKLLKNSSRPWLFTELVDSAREHDLAREIRGAGNLSSVGAPSWQPLPGDEDGAEEVLREWVSLRDRNVTPPEVFPEDGVVTVTWADLASFARCPLQFKLNRMTEHDVAGEAHTATGSGSAMPRGVDPAAFGVLVHEVLRRVAVGGKLDAALESSLQRQNLGKQSNAVAAAARTLVENALAAGVAGPAPGARTEVPFMVRLDRLLVRGVIDRIDVSADRATITDYKVGERNDEHSWQVRAYHWAASRLGVAPQLHARVVYLRADGVETVDVPTDGGLDSVVVALDAAVRSNGFSATPGTACTACGHRPTCAFAIERTGL
jgi:ATP-dependent DNA helicase UvrD/PcrA